jgi:hypothetical protein
MAIIKLPTESVLVNDEGARDIPENPVIVSNYENGEGVSITGIDGESIYFSYRMIPEIVKVLNAYSKPKKKSK